MWHAQKRDLARLGLTTTHTLLPQHLPKRTPWSHPATSSPPSPLTPLNISFLPHTLCGLSCMLTVPKHDEPFSPMGISPPSKPASATSVSVSQSGCNGSSGSSRVAAAVTWLRRQAASHWHSASTWLRGGTLPPARLTVGGKVLSLSLQLPEQILTHSWMTEEGCPATWGYFSHLDTRWTHWAADWRGGTWCWAPRLSSRDDCSLPVSTSPPTLRPLSPLPPCSPLACEGQSQQDFSSATILPPTVLWSCSSAPHLTWRLPRQNKGIKPWTLLSPGDTFCHYTEDCEIWWKSTVSMFVLFFLFLFFLGLRFHSL